MIYYLRIFCFLRGIYRTIRCGTWIEGRVVKGHDFKEQTPVEGQPACVEILKCETCGEQSVGWVQCSRCGHSNNGGADREV